MLLPPFFPEAPGNWLMVREPPRGEQKAGALPVHAQEQPYIPASKPVLGPAQETQVSLVGYNLGAGEVQVRAQVLGADGKEVGAGEIQVLEREARRGRTACWPAVQGRRAAARRVPRCRSP